MICGKIVLAFAVVQAIFGGLHHSDHGVVRSNKRSDNSGGCFFRAISKPATEISNYRANCIVKETPLLQGIRA